MPNIKAAEKWARQTEKRTLRNKDAKSRLKTIFKKAVAGGDTSVSPSIESAYDKAAKSGIIHKNKAARKKSRLAKAIARTAAAPEKTTKTRSTSKAKTKKAAK